MSVVVVAPVIAVVVLGFEVGPFLGFLTGDIHLVRVATARGWSLGRPGAESL